MNITKKNGFIVLTLDKRDSCMILKKLDTLSYQNATIKDQECILKFSLSKKEDFFSVYDKDSDLFILSRNFFDLLYKFLNAYCQSGKGLSQHIDLEFDVSNSKNEILNMMIEVLDYDKISEQEFISNFDNW